MPVVRNRQPQKKGPHRFFSAAPFRGVVKIVGVCPEPVLACRIVGGHAPHPRQLAHRVCGLWRLTPTSVSNGHSGSRLRPSSRLRTRRSTSSESPSPIRRQSGPAHLASCFAVFQSSPVRSAEFLSDRPERESPRRARPTNTQGSPGRSWPSRAALTPGCAQATNVLLEHSRNRIQTPDLSLQVFDDGHLCAAARRSPLHHGLVWGSTIREGGPARLVLAAIQHAPSPPNSCPLTQCAVLGAGVEQLHHRGDRATAGFSPTMGARPRWNQQLPPRSPPRLVDPEGDHYYSSAATTT